eukprot:513601-Prymnesium_polylepis.1
MVASSEDDGTLRLFRMKHGSAGAAPLHPPPPPRGPATQRLSTCALVSALLHRRAVVAFMLGALPAARGTSQDGRRRAPSRWWRCQSSDVRSFRAERSPAPPAHPYPGVRSFRAERSPAPSAHPYPAPRPRDDEGLDGVLGLLFVLDVYVRISAGTEQTNLNLGCGVF